MKRAVVSLAILICCGSAWGRPPETRPQIKGIYRVQIYTTNFEEAREFYSRVLGPEGACLWCEKLPHAAEGIYMSSNQVVTLLKAPKNPPVDLVYEIDFGVSDIGAMRKFLDANHVEIQKEAESRANSVVVLDPEGHRIGFIEVPEAPGTPPTSSSAPHLIHSGIVVRDRAAEDKFYKDVLGFHVYWHGGMKEGEDNWVDMQVPDGTDWVEYMLKVPENATHKQLGVMNHIAVGVSDVHAAEKQLIKAGGKPNEEPKIGRDGKWQLNLYDPDETRVELMEFTPTKEPCCSAYTGPHPGQKP